MYNPPLNRFPHPEYNPHQWARAAAWGQAVQSWLERYQSPYNRQRTRKTLASFLSACRKLPWEVRLEDGQRWVEENLQENTPNTRRVFILNIIGFYRYACQQTWTTPKGRTLPLCRSNPLEALPRPPVNKFLKAAPLTGAELERLFATFSNQTSEGRRARAIFQLVLDTGVRLRDVLRLTFANLQTLLAEGSPAGNAVRAFLDGEGRLASIEPDEFVFTRFRDGHFQPGTPPPPSTNGIRKPPRPCDTIFPGKFDRTDDWHRQPVGLIRMQIVFLAAVKQAGLDASWVSVETLRYTGAYQRLKAGAGAPEIAAYLHIKDLTHARRIMRALQASAELDPVGPRATLKKSTPNSGPMPKIKHGKNSARYSLKPLGIIGHKIGGVPSEKLPETIVRLRLMTRELFEQPSTGSAELEAQRLLKLSAMAEVIGKLKKRMVEEAWGKGPDGVKGKGMRLCVICPEAEACIDSPVCPLLGEEAEGQGLAPQGLAPQEMEPQNLESLRAWFDRRPRLGEKHKHVKREGQGLKYEELEARLREAFGEEKGKERERG